MKIAFNPSTVAALTTSPNNKDITFDLRGRNIFARGVKFYGTDTNTWRDIKINNVSIGSNILDLRNGSNTTLTNTDGVVTINSTWRPVVDNLTSDSTTSSLSAKQGKVLKALIDGKSNSDHNHDGRYLRLSGQDTMQGNLYLHSYGTSYIGKGLGNKSGADFTEANIVIRSWWGISFKSYDDIVRTYIDTRTGNIGTKGVLNAVGAVIQGRVYNGGDDEGIIINPASNGYAGLILGTHNGERSVFYLKKGNPFWRYNNGSTNLDIYHPKKSGTIALTSDIPDKNSWNYDDRYLRLTGGWMQGDINFGGDNKIHWGRNTDSASISFKNDGDGDADSYMSFVTSDNGNEYFRWSHIKWSPNSNSTNTEWMALKSDGLRVRGTKVSLEGHSHNDLYYTKAESNAKYITDITTSVNKLTFTRNGSNIARNITVNVVYSQGNLTNIPNKDATTKASPGLLIYDSYNQTIGTNRYSSVLSINTGGTIQIAGDWGDDLTRNLYWRSQSNRNVADYPWKSWRTILDSENYSSTLDSRYYTESEVNSLLNAKLNRQNLSYGNWNPRGWNLAADYQYNGGDISISENSGKMYVSVDGCFWQNEGQYRVLDTSDIGDIRDSVTLHQYLSATDAAWYSLVWGGASHNNTSDSTGPIYKSYDELCWQTSSQTLYATNIQTNNIKNLSIGGGIYWNPCVESASDSSDAASITLVRSGVAGGTTLVLSQMNDTNDTIQFKTNTAARLYHNSYPILTTQNTYVNNNKGYINGTAITQVNNSDTVDGYHATDGRTFNGNINWGGWNDTWSDGTHTHPWYGFDHRYPNTGAYSTTITDYYGMTIKTAKTLRLDCKDLLINGTNISNLTVNYANSAGNADTVDGEHASNFSYTHQTSFDFSKRKSGRIVTFDQSNTDYGWINGFASTHNDYLTSVIFNTHRTSNWYVGYMEGNRSTGETNGLQAVHRLAFADGDESYPIFLGCLDLYRGGDGTISSSFYCLGYSVPFTYTRGGNYCKIVIPNTTRLSFYIIAATASVNYSGGGMDTWTGYHRGSGAWWLHCYAFGRNEVRVKGFCQANENNDSWWGGNPLWNNEYGANRITVCIFGHVRYK